jgi:hypothetical protein
MIKMKDILKQTLNESKKKKYQLDILPGDIVLTGKFRNKPAIVSSFSTDENGQPVIITNTGKKLKFLSIRIQKLMPKK